MLPFSKFVSIRGTICISLLMWGVIYATECPQNQFFKDAGPLVQTASGKVLGKYIKYFDTDVAVFFGIPYARPPVGNLRFTKSVPAEPWDGILITQHESLSCIQFIPPSMVFLPPGNYSEDCLYLNVFAPRRRCNNKQDKLPVLVWIHGGALAMGAADTNVYDASKLVTHGEVIVVSMNYRVGPLGFLNVGNENAPGNVGLMDQVLALKWVKQNIEFFGGDPERVTIFGESAGSWSVSLHIISPMSRNLFHRAILQSGSMYTSCFTHSSGAARNQANDLAVAVECASDSVNLDTDPEKVTDCLKNKDPLTLSEMDRKIRGNTFAYVSAGNEFMPKKPIEAYDSGDIFSGEILIGATRDEGSPFLPMWIPDLISFRQEPKLSLEDIKIAIPKVFYQFSSEMHQKLYDTYFQNITDDNKAAIFDSLQMSLGDFIINCPVMFLAEKLNNAYLYWMTHPGYSESALPSWLGAHHGADLIYLFGKTIPHGKSLVPRDERFSNDFVKKWIDFARNGHPMSEENRHLWPKFSITEDSTYELNEENYKTIPFPRKHHCEFWRPIMSSASSTCSAS